MKKTNVALCEGEPSAITSLCQVESISAVSANTYQVELQSSKCTASNYLAGHYLQLELDVNNDGNPLTLFYSIANNPKPNSPNRLQLLLQKSSDFSAKVLSSLDKKRKNHEKVNVTLPMGQSFLQTDLNLPHLLIAAGSGIAKIKCLTEAILQQSPNANVNVYWSNRSIEDFYFLNEFEALIKQHENFTFTPILESTAIDWSGRSGSIYEIIQDDFDTLDDIKAYICGSPQMVYGTIDKLADKGLKEESCFSDAFEFAPRNN